MDKLRELQQRLNGLVKQLREAQAEENPDAAKVDGIGTEIRGLAAQIETEKAILASQGDPAPEGRSDASKPQKPEHADDSEHRAAILHYARTGDASELRDMTSGTAAGGDTGGYLIPQEWERQILERERETFVMRQLADVQMSELDRHIPVADDYGESEWITEGGAYPASDASFKTKFMEAFKVGRICKVSEELLQDNAYNLEQWLIQTFAYTNGLAMETAFINGDGVSKPRGFLLDADIVMPSGDELAYDDLLDLFASLKAGYYTRANWLMNVNTLTQIMKLKDDAGHYLYQPFIPKTPTDPIGQILGKPIVLSDLMQDIGGGNKPIAFGDFKRYRIHDRMGFSIQRLNERYADNGFIGFRGSQRTDGKLLVPEAVKLLEL